MEPVIYVLITALAITVLAVLVARSLYRANRELKRQNIALRSQIPIRKTAE